MPEVMVMDGPLRLHPDIGAEVFRLAHILSMLVLLVLIPRAGRAAVGLVRPPADYRATHLAG